MKKNLLAACFILLISFFLFSGCRKETTEAIASKEATTSDLASSDNSHHNKCRLVYLDFPNFYTWKFHYNDKGLADEWTVDFHDGFPHHQTMKYDKNNRLIKAYDYYNNTIYTVHFIYTGNRLTKQTWTNNNTVDDKGEILFTYNSKGQMVKQDLFPNDVHVRMFYDHVGNLTRSNIYLGSELYLADLYAFDKPVRNPCLTISGVDYPFLFYGTGLWNKQWFTSNRTLVYDNGKPFELVDYDPSKTVIKIGYQHFPIAARYYDRAIGGTVTYTFKYENCEGNCDVADSDLSSHRNYETDKTITRARPPLLMRSAKSIKQQIQELRKQYGK
jgi:hypothetical protein